MNIILASKSPRRKQLLSRLGLTFKIIESNYIEDEYTNTELPSDFACRLARCKALDVAIKYPGDLVIGSDTIVVSNEQVLGKPKNKKEAKEHLYQLSGNNHLVVTGVSIQIKEENIDHTFYAETLVTFHNLDKNDIECYVNSGNPFDKAGSYGIQDYSGIFVKKIEGCYDNVVGFPLSQFYLEIKKLGVNLNKPKI